MTRFTSFARATVVLTLASGLLAFAPPAFAGDDDSVPQAAVNIAGTDFTSAKAVAQLKTRVRHTAFAICTAGWDGKGLMTIDRRQCYETAMHNGIAQIDSKRLEALRQTSTTMAAVQPEEHPTH